MKRDEEESNMIDEKEINLLDYAIIFLKRKKMILVVISFFTLIFVLLGFIMKPIYKAETLIMPPDQHSMSSQLLNQVSGGVLGLMGGLLGAGASVELYVGILKSRTVLDKIIERFDLEQLYDEEFIEDTRDKLLKRISCEVDLKSGLISVAVEDKDPGRAAEMANAFIEELKAITQRIAITEASQRRLFFEEQLSEVRKSLGKAEDDMISFQEKTGMLQVDEQARAVIESIAALKAEIATKEIEIRALETFATRNNPELKIARESLKGMKDELRKLEKSEKKYDPIMSTSNIPSLGAEYIRRMRDLKYYEGMFEALSKQYEIARLDESNDAAVVQVVDYAVVPEKRAKPKRLLLSFIGIVVGFITSISAAFVLEIRDNLLNDPQNVGKVETIKKLFPLLSRGKGE